MVLCFNLWFLVSGMLKELVFYPALCPVSTSSLGSGTIQACIGDI